MKNRTKKFAALAVILAGGALAVQAVETNKTSNASTNDTNVVCPMDEKGQCTMKNNSCTADGSTCTMKGNTCTMANNQCGWKKSDSKKNGSCCR
jgi:hypothetical protein